jgi:hypothetical protein
MSVERMSVDRRPGSPRYGYDVKNCRSLFSFLTEEMSTKMLFYSVIWSLLPFC